MDFHGIDLNLLVAFDALMRERNVTRGADGLRPPPRARDLAEPIANALREIESTLVRVPEFVPDAASLTFNLGLSDYPVFVLLPSLMESLARKVLGVPVNVRAFGGRDKAVDLLMRA
ncbi:LysR family regulatory protein [Candidatus Paraburkholderia calva]|nr:LysR family regulatory protein [Candidatus Paraburkholderia calva]